jgi:pimeloyl-ACP methyl ester carboxylesterase
VGAGKIINMIVRILLLVFAALLVFIYALGIVANIFGLLEMRRPDEKIYTLLQASAGDRAIVTTIDYKGGPISYAGIRPPDGQNSSVVIFVHGSPGSMDAYTSYLLDEHLQAHASLFTYDRLGYGNSAQGNSDLSLAEQSEQLYTLAQHVGQKRNIFVGHSLGCSIIARLAMDHPDIVHGLIMVAAPIDPALEPSSWWRPLLEYPMISIAMPHAFRISNRELKPLKKDLEACLPFWDHVRCPVTFIHGDLDKLVPVANVDFGKRVLTQATVEEVILEDEGHFMLWTHEELIADEIVKMIEGE